MWRWWQARNRAAASLVSEGEIPTLRARMTLDALMVKLVTENKVDVINGPAASVPRIKIRPFMWSTVEEQ